MLTDELRSMFQNHVRKSTAGLPIGRDGRIRVHYFLDLLTACHDQACGLRLAQYFAAWLHAQNATVDLQYVVGPKKGNVLFAWQVAAALKVNSAFIRENVLFGRWIEGYLKPGEKAILIDDIASDGELLADAVADLKRVGIFIDKVFVLVDRTEGDANRFLGQSGIGYHFCVRLSDADLATL